MISELARRALTTTPAARSARKPEQFFGCRPFPGRGSVVTNEIINELRDEDVY